MLTLNNRGMKHYLFKTILFFIAFFSLGLTSCSNDDTPNTVGSDFTINGVNYYNRKNTGATNTFINIASQGRAGIQAELYSTPSDVDDMYPLYNVEIFVEDIDLNNLSDKQLDILGGSVVHITGIMQETKYNNIVSGSLYIKEYNSGKITLEFGHVKVVNSENEDDAVTLNGTLIFDYTEL